jgi:hypothetical protein
MTSIFNSFNLRNNLNVRVKRFNLLPMPLLIIYVFSKLIILPNLCNSLYEEAGSISDVGIILSILIAAPLVDGPNGMK